MYPMHKFKVLLYTPATKIACVYFGYIRVNSTRYGWYFSPLQKGILYSNETGAGRFV